MKVTKKEIAEAIASAKRGGAKCGMKGGISFLDRYTKEQLDAALGRKPLPPARIGRPVRPEQEMIDRIYRAVEQQQGRPQLPRPGIPKQPDPPPRIPIVRLPQPVREMTEEEKAADIALREEIRIAQSTLMEKYNNPERYDFSKLELSLLESGGFPMERVRRSLETPKSVPAEIPTPVEPPPFLRPYVPPPPPRRNPLPQPIRPPVGPLPQPPSRGRLPQPIRQPVILPVRPPQRLPQLPPSRGRLPQPEYRLPQTDNRVVPYGGARYDDEMEGGGFFSALTSIFTRAATKGSKAAATGATAATTVAPEVVTVTTKGAKAAAKAASEKAAKEAAEAAAQPSLLSRVGSKAMNAANLFGLAAGVALPIYTSQQIVKDEKQAAIRDREDALAQQKAEADAKKAKEENQKVLDDLKNAAKAEKELYEYEKERVRKAYDDAAADQKKQSDAFDTMMAMILSGKSDVQTSPAPPVASRPTQNEIDQAIADARGLPAPPTQTPVYTPPPPPPRTTPSVPAPPPMPPSKTAPRRTKFGGARMKPTAAEIKKAIATARRM
jgi:hypothetical protein